MSKEMWFVNFIMLFIKSDSISNKVPTEFLEILIFYKRSTSHFAGAMLSLHRYFTVYETLSFIRRLLNVIAGNSIHFV